MKKMSSGRLNQKLKRETTNATDAAKRRISAIAGNVMYIEFRKCRWISPCVQACR